MAKAVLISIRPELAAKILGGKKTLELRKNRPALRTPFKCYIYCTRVQSMNLNDYVGVHSESGGRVDEWSGKVVGEFICDEIKRISVPDNPTLNDLDMPIYENSCLSYEQIRDYCKGQDGFFWHISNLRIYDAPKEVGYFVGIRRGKEGVELKALKSAPQSWCYVLEGTGVKQ